MTLPDLSYIIPSVAEQMHICSGIEAVITSTTGNRIGFISADARQPLILLDSRIFLRYARRGFLRFFYALPQVCQNPGKRQLNTQWYRSGHNEHDWKSCVGQKPTEGSNPSHCAIIKREFACFGKFPLDFATFERISVISGSQQTARRSF